MAINLSSILDQTNPVQLAKAWVNFNGSSGAVIGTSYNIGSITRYGLGDYGVNFTTSLSSTNYVVIATGSHSANLPNTIITNPGRANTVSSAFIASYNTSSGAALDVSPIGVVVFGS